MVDYTAAAADLIKTYDRDGDSELGIEEFKDLYNAFKEKRPDVLKYTPEELFGFIDKDLTGTISLAELADHLKEQNFDPSA